MVVDGVLFARHGPPQLQQNTLHPPVEQHSQGCTLTPSSHWHFKSLKNIKYFLKIILRDVPS